MRARVIQHEQPGDDNRGEQAMLAFLCDLPEGFVVYRELKVALDQALAQESGKKPDFIVVGEGVGLLSIEVKDWNIHHNTFHWRDQLTVIRRDKRTGHEIELTNPMAQVDMYLHALLNLIDGKVFVGSMLAFPRLTRSEFLNAIGDRQLVKDPQSKFYLDPGKTIFKDDIDTFSHAPQELLRQLAKRHRGYHYHKPNLDQLRDVQEMLLPSAFHLGGSKRRTQERATLQMMTETQEQWIVSQDEAANYLLDVAGSGKTNVLVSRALHIIDTAHKQHKRVPNVLLTTYNPNLQRNIEYILNSKITATERDTIYKKLIVENVAYIMERIVVTGYGYDNVDEYHILNPPSTPDYREQLREDVRNVMQDFPGEFCVFDYVFIDEIQDFDDEQLDLVRRLCRTENFFFVGDMGQKLYDRYHDLKLHGFKIEPIQLPSTHMMYRTPKGIAQLAYRFLKKDRKLWKELEKQGYSDSPQYESYSENSAVLIMDTKSVESIALRIQERLEAGEAPDDFMIITAEEHVTAFRRFFKELGIPFTLGHPRDGKQVSIIDFMNVKGLEREVVIINGIEDLYDHRRDETSYGDTAILNRREGFMRRKLYVALTRAIEECYIYYTNPQNRFIKDLIEINRDIVGGPKPGE